MRSISAIACLLLAHTLLPSFSAPEEAAPDGLDSAPNGPGPLTHLRLLGDPAFKHAHQITHIEQFSDGRLLTAAEDGAARLWNLKTGAELLRLDHGDIDVWNTVALQGETHIATAGEHVRIWDVESGEMTRQLDDDEDCYRLTTVPGTKLLASGHDNGRILIRDWETGETIHKLKYDKDEVYTLVAPTKDRLIASGDDGILQLWDIGSGEELNKIEPDQDSRVTTVSLSPDRSRILVNQGKTLFCHQCSDLKELWKAELDGSTTISAWSPDGKHAVTCSDEKLFLINTKNGKTEWESEFPLGDHRAVAFSRDGKTIFSGGDQMVYRFSPKDGSQLYPPPKEAILRDDVALGGFSNDGKMVFAGGRDLYLHRYDTTTGKALPPLKTTHRTDAAGVSPDGKSVIAADDDGNLSEFTLPALKPIQRANIGDFYDFTVANAGIVITEYSDTITRFGRNGELGTLGGEDSDFEGVTISPDGKFVATASGKAGGVRIWKPETGELIRVIGSQIDSPDDLYLFSDATAVIVIDDANLFAWFKPSAPTLNDKDKEIARAVARLASDGFAEREEAKRLLIGLGGGVTPYLEKLEPTDPEVRQQIAQVLRHLRDKLAGEVEQALALDDDVEDFAAHPDGKHWAAVVGYGHRCQIVTGVIDTEKNTLSVLQTISDSNGPDMVRFSPKGDFLATGNGNGTVSLYRFTADAAEEVKAAK